MKSKILIIFVILISSVFFNFLNKHNIIKYSQKIDQLEKILHSKQELNQDLLSINSKLISRDRIQKLAYEKLGMIYSSTPPRTIYEDRDKRSYRLIDFIVPTAEALNN